MKKKILLVLTSLLSLSAFASDNKVDESTLTPLSCIQKSEEGYSADDSCMGTLIKNGAKMQAYQASLNRDIAEQSDMQFATVLFYPERMEIVVVGHRD